MNGDAYADTVAAELRAAGLLAVRREDDVAKARWSVHGRSHIPFDVSYRSLVGKILIECKWRDAVADERDVAKFLADLRLVDHPVRRALVVTNNGYAPLARDYAHAEGLRLYTFGAPGGGRTLFRLRDELPRSFQRVR